MITTTNEVFDKRPDTTSKIPIMLNAKFSLCPSRKPLINMNGNATTGLNSVFSNLKYDVNDLLHRNTISTNCVSIQMMKMMKAKKLVRKSIIDHNKKNHPINNSDNLPRQGISNYKSDKRIINENMPPNKKMKVRNECLTSFKSNPRSNIQNKPIKNNVTGTNTIDNKSLIKKARVNFSQNKIMTSSDKIKHLELENIKLLNKITSNQNLIKSQDSRLQEYERNLNNYKCLLETEQTSTKILKEKIYTCENQIKDLMSINSKLEYNYETILGQNKNMTDEIESLRTKLSYTQELLDKTQCIKGEFEQKYNFITHEHEILLNHNKNLEASNIVLSKNNHYLCSELVLAEINRKLMHNEIMDLKGNIRVFCRIRPFVDTELSGVSSQNYCIYPMADDENTVEVAKFTDKSTKKIKTTELNESGALIYKYKFDKVFDHTSTQSQVYEEVSGVIQSALDGFNICVFAYGATGSGKTFTMEGNLSLSHTLPDCGKESEMYDSTVKVGDAGEPDFEAEEVKSRYGNMGLIPRAFSHIFSHLRYIKQLNSNGASETKHAESSGTVVTYELTASFIEIYNEKIRDLLWTGKQNLQPDYEIKMVDGSKSEELIIVPEVTKIKVINWKQVESILKRASKNRAVAETNLNLSSSRSHSVFQLRIDKTNLSNKNTPVTSSTLSLVDLAGSERIKQSGSTSGERLLEAKHINSSLSTLSTVITSLTNRTNKGKMGTGKKNAEIQHHVPYRNSKLTYLLKSSLGAGNSKTLMFVNVSPIEDRLEETLCSLRFAAKVNSCNIGVATVNKP